MEMRGWSDGMGECDWIVDCDLCMCKIVDHPGGV